MIFNNSDDSYLEEVVNNNDSIYKEDVRDCLNFVLSQLDKMTNENNTKCEKYNKYTVYSIILKRKLLDI